MYIAVIFVGLLRRIEELYKPLCEKLVAKKVAVEMFQRDALLLRELESIQVQKKPYKASEELLHILLQLPEDEVTVLDRFLEALKITNQQHIFLWLMYPGKIETNVIDVSFGCKILFVKETRSYF